MKYSYINQPAGNLRSKRAWERTYYMQTVWAIASVRLVQQRHVICMVTLFQMRLRCLTEIAFKEVTFLKKRINSNLGLRYI